MLVQLYDSPDAIFQMALPSLPNANFIKWLHHIQGPFLLSTKKDETTGKNRTLNSSKFLQFPIHEIFPPSSDMERAGLISALVQLIKR